LLGRIRIVAGVLAAVASLCYAAPVAACVGTACLQLWSTAAGSGALTVEFDFSSKIQTFKSFCTSGNGQCLYTNLDPGFIATTDAVPGSGFFPLLDGTTVQLAVVRLSPGLTVSINGQRLDTPEERVTIGTMPDIHNHPSWQLLLPGDEVGDYAFTFRLETDAPAYADSADITVMVTNRAPTPEPGTPTATPTATATPAPTGCAGDCDGDGAVTVDEVLTCVHMALFTSTDCPACDSNQDDFVTVDEIIAALNVALVGCEQEPQVTLAEIQQEIFTPTCATVLCHNAASAAGDLDLSAGASRVELVNIVPSAEIAAQAGQLRVDPGDPDNSFLLIKLIGPPLGAGSRMPLIGLPLAAEQIETIRTWILRGAQP